MPEDFERDMIKRKVQQQGVYDYETGGLLDEFVGQNLVTFCYAAANSPSTDCSEAAVRQVASEMDVYSEIAAEMAAYLANRPNGPRPQLNTQQKEAVEKFKELAKKACDDTTREVGESAAKWGMRVHQRFGELVADHANFDSKFFGETGYRAGALVNRGPGSGGASFPDAVCGPNRLQPEMQALRDQADDVRRRLGLPPANAEELAP
jgi:hypothetical protein